MSIVSVNNLVKEFGDVVAVTDASFDIEDGEFVSILGPSGSGKSTILRMIAGFEAPTSGTITLDGQNVVGVPPFNRDVNMVFQSLALFPHLTVAENIGYGLKQRGVAKAERADRITEMLSVVHLEGYEDRMPDELSGGEQQRVALARAIVNEPKLVLFDEPLASLDRKLRQHMQVELQRIQAETGITFLYVTHDQEVAVSVSDRMILLREGRIEQIGSPEELYDTPRSRFVADFIGDVNTFPGRVSERTNGSASIEVLETSLRVEDVSASRLSELSTDDPVDVCFRPHSLSVCEAADSDTPAVNGTVVNRIYQGKETKYVVETETGQVTVEDDAEFAIDDDVVVSAPREGAYVFPQRK